MKNNDNGDNGKSGATSSCWLGIITAREAVTITRMEFPDNGNPIVTEDDTWTLQTGDRPEAYRVMYERIVNYLVETKVQFVVIKGSAISGKGVMGLVHLEAAELRGVVTAAAATSGAAVRVMTKAEASKKFGHRNTDAYVADEDFWESKVDTAKLRKGSRENVFLILTARKLNEK